METTSYAVYLRKRDAFGSEYHEQYNTGLSLEVAQQQAREAATWQNPGTTLIIVKEIKTVELLDGPEFRFEAMPRPRRGDVAPLQVFNDDWDN